MARCLCEGSRALLSGRASPPRPLQPHLLTLPPANRGSQSLKTARSSSHTPLFPTSVLSPLPGMSFPPFFIRLPPSPLTRPHSGVMASRKPSLSPQPPLSGHSSGLPWHPSLPLSHHIQFPASPPASPLKRELFTAGSELSFGPQHPC